MFLTVCRTYVQRGPRGPGPVFARRRLIPTGLRVIRRWGPIVTVFRRWGPRDWAGGYLNLDPICTTTTSITMSERINLTHSPPPCAGVTALQWSERVQAVHAELQSPIIPFTLDDSDDLCQRQAAAQSHAVDTIVRAGKTELIQALPP